MGTDTIFITGQPTLRFREPEDLSENEQQKNLNELDDFISSLEKKEETQMKWFFDENSSDKSYLYDQGSCLEFTFKNYGGYSDVCVWFIINLKNFMASAGF